MTRTKPTIVWFRRDLRISDNPALDWAVKNGRPILCVYIHDPLSEWAPGGASRWWLHHSLRSLASALKAAHSNLHIICGGSEDSMHRLIEDTGADSVAWNRRYEPAAIALDSKIKKKLTDSGVKVVSFPGNYCYEPWQIQREGKHPYRVFTAYWRASLKQAEAAVGNDSFRGSLYNNNAPAAKIPRYTGSIDFAQSLETLDLLPTIPWDSQFGTIWCPGEKGASHRLQQLLRASINDYDSARDIPSLEGTSRLSPHLAFGEITPRQILAAIARHLIDNKLPEDDQNIVTYRREIAWREFACHLLYHFPQITNKPLDVRYEKFPWKKNRRALKRWQQGKTGIPLVDAGMRQLWQTGWMHNRVRMVVASLLIKNMGIHWLEGARWFWDTLLDADLASNSMGWQWVAGSGADAAPYFRVFNPVRQGQRFDPEGIYIRQWVPELAKLGNKTIHAPWTATEKELSEAGIVLGKTYPNPIVDLAQSRLDALKRFDKIKQHN
ncbi:hypothetical protein AB833_07220 [Chromatiales bacterium (ex Bugula neritina AB1)]|nr:hypothetical protein AB833_07220 [Chromatiales bacterium (ex Bugula neritina AB1)]